MCTVVNRGLSTKKRTACYNFSQKKVHLVLLIIFYAYGVWKRGKNLLRPWIVSARLDRLQGFPHHTPALETTSKRDLPNPVTSSDAPLCLTICKLIPHRGRRNISVSVQCRSRRLQVPILEPQVGLHCLKDAFAAGMDAKMLEGRCEIGDM